MMKFPRKYVRIFQCVNYNSHRSLAFQREKFFLRFYGNAIEVLS